MGKRPLADSAALQAQAIASRTYALSHMPAEEGQDRSSVTGKDGARAYDVSPRSSDQVYGGADAETAATDAAIASTRGLVLVYAGRVINALYHSTCGGSTAEASEVWRAAGQPYLQRVSDRIPGSERYYCDIAPRFRWTASLSSSQLDAAVGRYLARIGAGRSLDSGSVTDVVAAARTPAGRVAVLDLRTDRGTVALRGNEMRTVLRQSGGEMLNSTYFSIQPEKDTRGALVRVLLEGRGYGHGVGMCQWGAIGRARAGQDYRSILQTYYPGAKLGIAE
jgi:stage II sporulation protein D